MKAVIFDLDGTLLDTLPDILDNINLMLTHFGYKTIDLKTIKKYVGCGAKNLVKQSIGLPLTDSELNERLAYYNKFYTASSSPKTKLFNGIDNLLTDLKNRGFKLAILTNKPQETTDKVLKNYLEKYGFDAVVGEKDGVKIKPDKTATLNILKDMGVEPKDAYFVGDGETDVLTAINSGTNGIATLWGYRDKEDLVKAGAKVFADTPKDVSKLIK